MPGVPAGRGCEGCRRQKKKCDQAKPACSRCARLRIPCVGGGVQRFKFQEAKEQRAVAQATRLDTTVAGIIRRSVEEVAAPNQAVVLHWEPSNEMTVMAYDLVSKLKVTDLRYNLAITYGPFLKGVPKRLGNNRALDAAVGALTASFSLLHAGEAQVDAIVKYGSALKAVREVLGDPKLAATPDTICAIYILMICQGWHSERHENISSDANHTDVLAILLSHADFSTTDAYEVEMLLTMLIPVILGTVGNPKTQWFCDMIINNPPPSVIKVDAITPYEGMKTQKLAKLPGFILAPRKNLPEIKEMYAALQRDASSANERLDRLEDMLAAAAAPPSITSDTNMRDKFRPVPEPTPVGIATAQYRSFCGLLAAITLSYNRLIMISEPDNRDLEIEAAKMCDRIVDICSRVVICKPLGSAFAPLCLLTAYACMDDPERKLNLGRVLAMYDVDTPGSRWMERARSAETLVREADTRADGVGMLVRLACSSNLDKSIVDRRDEVDGRYQVDANTPLKDPRSRQGQKYIGGDRYLTERIIELHDNKAKEEGCVIL